MTVWISNNQIASLRVPGVYGMRRNRAQRTPIVRTDIAGFIGFDTRIRAVSATLSPSPTTGPGHRFLISIAACRLGEGADTVAAPAFDIFELADDNTAVPMAIGQAIRYTLAVVDADWEEDAGDLLPAPPAPLTPAEEAEEARKLLRRRRNIVVVPGAAAAAGRETAPDEPTIAAAIEQTALDAWDESPTQAAAHTYQLLAHIQIRRTAADAFRTVVIPHHRLIRCDDWREFILRLGPPVEDGAYLAPSVRGYFACGGSRCYISLLDRPEPDDTEALSHALDQLLGDDADPIATATGRALLLHEPEVAVIDAPDLYARRASEPESLTLPPAATDACFRPCNAAIGLEIDAALAPELAEPLFDLPAVLDTQLALIRLMIPHRWRALLLLAPPLAIDTTSGRYQPPDAAASAAWRDAIHTALSTTGIGDPDEVSVAALYAPWLIVQEVVGAPQTIRPPTGFAAGIIAARDLARGPAVSPANVPVTTAVGTTSPITDDDIANLYTPDRDASGNPRPSVNPMRPRTGGGVELWGARTLSTEHWLRYLAVRRGLSAIERRCHAALERTVFEPNTPALWMQVTQITLNVLMSLFRDGSLRGESPQDAFYVRCDSSVNPPESIAMGRLIVEVGVAIAAPAEFIVFRLGRSEGIVEVLE